MKNIVHRLLQCVLLATCLAVAGCKTTPTQPPLRPVAKVDLQRFMGDWYVIAHIPTFLEKGAYNAVESYQLQADGTIATTFTFNQDALDGPVKTYRPKGFVRNSYNNAEWGMQFVWPIKADYVIVHLDPDYRQTIIARPQRDFVWIMARTPDVAASDYDSLVEQVRQLGYEVNLLRRVPHQTKP